jgi:glycosyltransferase involved in cell wall biosynthesis
MTVYGDLRFLDAAVDSVLRQTYTDLELVIVDDGTGQEQAFSRLAAIDPRVRVLTNAQNVGTYAAAVRGIEAARGDVIARLDADDILEPESLARRLAVLEGDPELGLIGSWATLIDEDDRETGMTETPATDLDVRWTILFRNPFVHSSVAFRRPAYVAAGGYDSTLRRSGDHDLWARLLEVCRAGNVPEPLVRHRVNPRGLWATGEPDWRQRTEPLRRRSWAELGVNYDAELLPALIRFTSGQKVADVLLRARVYDVALALLGAFLARRPRRDNDSDSRSALCQSIVGRIVADDGGGALSAKNLLRCVRQSPLGTMRGVFRRFGRLWRSLTSPRR